MKNGINKIVSEIKKNIFYLLDKAKSIQNIALNNFDFEIENEYIENLIATLKETNNEHKNEIEELKEKKIYNDIYLKITKLSKEELDNINNDEFINKINEMAINNLTK